MGLPYDKQWHAIGGGAVALIVGAGVWPFAAHGHAILAGIFAAGLAGLLKEIFDSFDPKHHTVDWKDFLATLAGGLVVALLGILLLALGGCGGRPRVPVPEISSPATAEASTAPTSAPTPPTAWLDRLTTPARIIFLEGQLAAAKKTAESEREQARQAITAAQARWGTWAAGLTFLAGLALFVASWWIQVPKVWGIIGMALGAALLVGARVWSQLGEISGPLGTMALAGGALTTVALLIWHHRKYLRGLVR